MVDVTGVWSETMDADEGTEKICDQVKSQVEKKTGKHYAKYTAVKYRQEILTRETHFLIKVHVGDVNYIHLYVILMSVPNSKDVPIPPPTLKGFQQNKTKDDPLEPF